MSELAEIKRGTTYQDSLELIGEDGEPLDATGWTFESDIKSHEDGNVLASFTFDTTDVNIGVVLIRLESTETSPLPADSDLIFDVRMVDTAGDVWQTETKTIKTSKRVTVR